MANAKNKHSSKIHSRARFAPSYETPARKLILIVIILIVFTVSASITCSIIFDAEHTVKSTISSLAADYYEDYLYRNISSSGEDIDTVMQKYVNTGFSAIPLRQLIFRSSQGAAAKDTILKYCDEDATHIQFFPTAPFGKADYKVEYTYSCSF